MRFYLALLFFISTPVFGEQPNLVIHAYSSFVSAWGPGPKLIEEFKKKCQCQVELKDMGDTNLFLDRVTLKKTPPTMDLVLGLDQLLLKKALQKLSWISLQALSNKESIGSAEYTEFLAFDWAPLAFVYRRSELERPPQSLEDLLDARFKGQILIPDPRLSTPGMQFLAWIYLVKKDQTKSYLEKLKPQIHSLPPSWSAAYGLFKKKQGKLVFSYLSSPVYHWKEEKDEDYQSLGFKEKHPVQIEWVGIPSTSKNVKLAQDFVKFLLSESSQKTIMDLNFMFPVTASLVKGSLYEKLPKVETFQPQLYKELSTSELLKIWKEVFR